MLSGYCLPNTVGSVDRGIITVYYGEWNRSARLKMHINMVCPGKTKEIIMLRVEGLCKRKFGTIYSYYHIVKCRCLNFSLQQVRVLSKARMQIIQGEGKKASEEDNQSQN